MMNKLEMAQEYIVSEIRRVGVCSIDLEKIAESWNIADAMQAEADKRVVKLPDWMTGDMKNHEHDFIYGRVCACGKVKDVEEEWQPDWRQAPENMTHFAVDANGSGWFFNREPHTESDNCWYCGDDSVELIDHNYKGPWQDSVRKRP